MSYIAAIQNLHKRCFGVSKPENSPKRVGGGGGGGGGGGWGGGGEGNKTILKSSFMFFILRSQATFGKHLYPD